MHTLRLNDDGRWEVGCYANVKGNMIEWVGLTSYETQSEAAAVVCYLNGGEHPQRQPSSPLTR